jgi:hypothetical protein
MLLFANPLALAIASMVSDDETMIGPVYTKAGVSPLMT